MNFGGSVKGLDVSASVKEANTVSWSTDTTHTYAPKDNQPHSVKFYVKWRVESTRKQFTESWDNTFTGKRESRTYESTIVTRTPSKTICRMVDGDRTQCDSVF